MTKHIVAALLASGVLLFGGAALYHEGLQKEQQVVPEPHSTAIYMTEEEASASGECVHGIEPYYAHQAPGAVPMELLVGYRCSPEASAAQ